MSIEVTMPQLGETVAEGTVTRWLRQVGQTVGDQEPLVEIATDKVDAEIPSPASGTLLEIRVSENATVAVGTVIAVIGESHSTAVRAPRHHHSPLVRRLAREAGLDLDSLVGTGPGGRATRAHVVRAMAERTAPSPEPVAVVVAEPPTVVADQPAPVDSAERREPMSRLRRPHKVTWPFRASRGGAAGESQPTSRPQISRLFEALKGAGEASTQIAGSSRRSMLLQPCRRPPGKRPPPYVSLPLDASEYGTHSPPP